MSSRGCRQQPEMSSGTSSSRRSLSQVSLSSSQHSSSGKGKKSKRGGQQQQQGNERTADLPPEACSMAIPITSSFSKPGAGGGGKQGFRFSLRRMLYNSPLVVQRRARSLSTGNNLASTSGSAVPGSSSTASGLSTTKKKQSTSSCTFYFYPLPGYLFSC